MQISEEKIKRVSEGSRMSSEAKVPPIARQFLYLEISNFRCFRKHTVIGPFDRITGIIGPNGGGKSTVMDAISFCLCKDIVVHSKVFNYNELTNVEPVSKKQAVSVKLHLSHEEDKQVIERVLDSHNKFQYFIDDKQVTNDEYTQFLDRFNLLGFTILHQEELQIFTSKTPNELMLLFEKISGSYAFKEAYQGCQKELDKLNFEIVEKNDQLKNLKRDKKNSKALVTSNRNVMKIFDELDELEKDLLELQLLHFHLRFNTEKEKADELHATAQSIVDQIDRLSAEIIRAKAEIKTRNIEKEKRELNQQIKQTEQTVAMLEEQIRESEQNLTSAEKQKSILFQELQSIREMEGTLDRQRKRLEETIKDYEAEIDAIRSSKNSLKNKSILQEKKFIDFIKKYNTENSQLQNLNTELAGIEADIDFIEKRKNNVNQQWNTLTNKKNTESSELVNLQRQMNEVDMRKHMIQDQLSQVEKQIAIANHNKTQQAVVTAEINAMRQRLTEIEHQILADKNQHGILAHICSVTDGFHGEMSSLITPIDKKFALPIGIALLKVLDHLTFENFEDAKKAGAILKAHFVQRNALILSNVPFNSIKYPMNEIRAFIGAKGHLAFDLVQTKKPVPYLKEFLEFYLNGIVICDSVKNATLLKKDLGNKISKIITLDGTVIKDQEMISLGVEERYPQKLKRFLRHAHVMVKSAADEQPTGAILEEGVRINTNINTMSKTDIEKHIAGLEVKLDNLKSLTEGDEKQARDLQRQLKNLEKDKHNCINGLELADGRIRSIDRDIAQLSKEKESLDVKMESCEVDKARIQEQITRYLDTLSRLKSTFVNQNKSMVANSDELEKAILATKDVEIEVDKVRQKITTVQIEISNLGIAELESKYESTQSSLRQFEGNIALLRDRIHAVFTQLEETRNTLNQQTSQRDELNKSSMSKEERVQEITQKIKDLDQRLKLLKKQEATKREEMEKIKLARQEFLDEQEMKGAISDQDFRQRLRNHSQRSMTQNRGMLVEGESGSDVTFDYDYSRILQALGLAFIQEVNVDQIVKIASFKDQKKNELKKHLKELTTNINSEALVQVEVTKIEHISEKLKDLQKTMTDLFSREKELKTRLEDISSKRTNILLSFLTPLSLIIPNFYKLVNCDERASASFIIENPFKPFLNGVIFNATPPTKKFSIGTEGLSTGESSLANLALFLALNEVKGSPVIMFDEIDAHLDAENVFKFVSAFGKSSSIKQVVFVSHKPFVFKRADMLLGITKNHADNSATSYSFNTKFWEQQKEQR